MTTNKDFSTVSNNARQRDNAMYVGIVKNNDDPQNMGRLEVYIPEIGGNPDDPSAWITVKYAPMFGGSTNPKKLVNDQTQAGSQQSYGWWGQPPDLENQVLLAFANGDIARGYWWACVYQQNMNFMVPGIPAGPATDPNSKNNNYLSPTVEYNKLNVQSTSSPVRPIYAPLTNGLLAQGLQRDFERGPSSSSARRESPSKVFGYLTPDGSQLYADDNPANEFIRMRTKSGVQVLINETTGYVYINSKSGNSWVEVSDLGIDMYSQGSISLRAEKDFNVRADGNINFDAGAAINLRAGSDILLQAGKTIQAGASSGLVLSVSSGTLNLSSSGDMLQHAGGAWRSNSSGDMTLLAGGAMNRTATQISDNGPAAPSVAATTAQAQKGTVKPNIAAGKSGTLNTTASRMPTHEPWTGHPKANVPPPPTSNAPVMSPGIGSQPPTNNVPSSTMQTTGDGKQIPLTNADGQQCATGVGTKKCSDDVYNSIQTASATTGAPFGSMMAIADVESSFNPNAGASSSSASGLYQFTSGTWNGMKTQYGNQYNISSDTATTDPTANATLAGAFYQQNAQILMNNGISNPSCGQVYSLHLLGGTGGAAFVAASQNTPDAPLSSVLSQTEINNNPLWFRGCQTVGQAADRINGTMNAKSAAYGTQAGLPSPCSRTGTSTTTASNTGNASATGALAPTTNTTGSQG